MSKQQVIIIGLLWNMIVLFLGFPFWVDKIIVVMTSVILIGLIYSLRIDMTPRTKKHSPVSDVRHAPYAEHKSSPDTASSVTPESVN